MSGISTLIALSNSLSTLSNAGFKEFVDFEYEYDKCAKLKNAFIQAIFRDGDNYPSDHLAELFRKAKEIETNERMVEYCDETKQSQSNPFQIIPVDVQAEIMSYLPFLDGYRNVSNVSVLWLSVARNAMFCWIPNDDISFYKLQLNLLCNQPKFKLPLCFNQILLNQDILEHLMRLTNNRIIRCKTESKETETSYASKLPHTIAVGM